MMIRKIFSLTTVLTLACGLSSCGVDHGQQHGPLSMGASDGEIENTICSVAQESNAVADMVINTSDASLWITAVNPVRKKEWESSRAMASVIGADSLGLYGWGNEDLENPETKRIVDSLSDISGSFEVPAGRTAIVAIEGVVSPAAQKAEVSQMQVSYKKDPASEKSATVVGNIRYEWDANSCD